MKVAIAAGGTAGHVVPALAVADALRAEGAEVEFVGGERAEAELVPGAGYPLHALRVAGIDRRNPLRALRAVGLALSATLRARRLLREIGADVVIGGGGYVAGPVGLAARSLRLPLVLTEADSHLGIANRLLTPAATRVFLAFPLSGRDGGRYAVVGRPIPAGTLGADRATARERFGIGADDRCLLVFGGSLGARTINEATIEAFGAAAPCIVLHACGRRDNEDLARRLECLGSPPHYRLHAYIQPFADALAAADLAVARSGGSVFEVAAAGVPSILVPYPHATADHQALNARHFAAGGAAVVVPDAELDGPRLAREVGALLADEGRLHEMGRAARALARPDAAEAIAREVLALGNEAAL
ncbi:MAG TPA: UDP-N-acetylglucosamine--N-acetylmuramyl-(pentapeptide) pyrophosphoryl-undecaprenol N-acetylglucosamine transferase [Thermoleophilaceae bacterium]|nr:UDP-N-acetylglucosamine--N-acetylmuramyl-(pentapeptide) pyrophosphoryl-undecaprenol N-acetylglucosamine transferase [Thermoleophilaceae bacterium]